MDDMVAIGRLVGALRPWLPQLVLVGGWAHRLYRLHEDANSPRYQPLTTKDADVALSLGAPPVGDIGAALAAAGFEPDLRGEHTPPVTYYRLGGEDRGFSVEFLAPLHGSGMRRDGSPDATLATAGVTAQKLRYLDLLLARPWSIRLGPDAGIHLGAAVDIQLAGLTRGPCGAWGLPSSTAGALNWKSKIANAGNFGTRLGWDIRTAKAGKFAAL